MESRIEEFIPGLLIIGFDGGDTAYCIDDRNNEKIFVQVPFIGMDSSEVKRCGDSFTEFFSFLYNTKLR
ncbi:SMI1/KNR4 family protein [Aneurinibacillus sp. REN35]|uniref:SMI1/KNR4 family protein n=1 Tax=Aneurinibacillus sp. REN35 TaxID=3237286 RepID=UPI0035289A4B